MDKFGTTRTENYSPGEKFTAVTPDNDTDLAEVTRGLYVGSAGDLKINDRHGNAITLKNLAAGVIHPIRASRVFATGTTALDIVAVS